MGPTITVHIIVMSLDHVLLINKLAKTDRSWMKQIHQASRVQGGKMRTSKARMTIITLKLLTFN